jgi:maltodextrin utilization protein YvdJ
MACPVCFGGEDTLMRESLNAGIGVLMGVTAIVLACFATFFVRLARRSRAAAHLVEGMR